MFLYFLIVFVLVSVYLDRGSALPYAQTGIPMHAGWTTEAGEAVDLAEMPRGDLDLTADVSGLDIDGKSLCMKSIDTRFDVYADGELIYSYRPGIPRRLGASYGKYVHTIPIPGDTVVLGLLTYRGVSDYYYLVNISHALILLALAVIVFLLVRAIRRHTIQKELLRSLTVRLAALVAGVVVDIVRYYILQSYGSSSYTRIGVLVFTLMIGVYLFREQTRVLKLKQQENAQFISEITTAFAKVIDMKDSYTNGHSSRVAKYTAMLSRELGYDEETVEKYYRIALLHDVGKIGVPKAVLNKPGKLTDEEFDIIKSHTVKGYEVLKDISIMPELAVGAQSHHERPDGKDYPNRLKTGEIPRVAQIIAVADCFDAMYSNRPYRKRMNFDKAVSIIREVSGTQLTGDVVDAFLRLVEKGEFRDPNDQGGGSTENIENIRK